MGARWLEHSGSSEGWVRRRPPGAVMAPDEARALGPGGRARLPEGGVEGRQRVRNQRHLGALVFALHRVAQRCLPLVVAGAGLPSLRGLSGEAESYAERRFEVPAIGSRSAADAAEAIVAPARAAGVEWEPRAAALVVERTEGYPHFLPEFGRQAWDLAPGPARITRADVERSAELTLLELDDGFFRVRFDRTSDAERAYLRAMAGLGPGPSGEVAAALGKTTGQRGAVRDRLIQRGLCCAPRWGQSAFTAPMFDGCIRRRGL